MTCHVKCRQECVLHVYMPNLSCRELIFIGLPLINEEWQWREKCFSPTFLLYLVTYPEYLVKFLQIYRKLGNSCPKGWLTWKCIHKLTYLSRSQSPVWTGTSWDHISKHTQAFVIGCVFRESRLKNKQTNNKMLANVFIAN